MKQLLAITFIGMLALSQYAKQLSYLECKLVNSLKPTEQRCDCEKINETDNFAVKEFPTPKNHIHLSLDEFYTNSKDVLHTIKNLPGLTIFSIPGNEAILCGIQEQPDRPPCAL